MIAPFRYTNKTDNFILIEVYLRMGWGGGDVLEWHPAHFGMKVLRREAKLIVIMKNKKTRFKLKPACLLWPRVKIKTERIYT